MGMAGGGALWKFIEGLFIKASNDIRLGRGMFKGLTEKQRIVQHDNLTKMVEQFQKLNSFLKGQSNILELTQRKRLQRLKLKQNVLEKERTGKKKKFKHR